MSILYLIIKLTTSASSSILWQILNDTLCLSCCRGSTENLNKVWKIWKKMVFSNIKKYLSICIWLKYIMKYVYFEICLDTFNWSEFLFSSWVCRISRSCLSERMDREYSTVRIADSEIQSNVLESFVGKTEQWGISFIVLTLRNRILDKKFMLQR